MRERKHSLIIVISGWVIELAFSLLGVSVFAVLAVAAGDMSTSPSAQVKSNAVADAAVLAAAASCLIGIAFGLRLAAKNDPDRKVVWWGILIGGITIMAFALLSIIQPLFA